MTPHRVIATDPGTRPAAHAPIPSSPVGEPDGQGPVLVINPEVTPPDVKTDPGKHGQGKHGQGKGHPGKTGRTGGGVVVVQTPNTRDWVCDVAPCGPPTHPQIEAL